MGKADRSESHKLITTFLKWDVEWTEYSQPHRFYPAGLAADRCTYFLMSKPRSNIVHTSSVRVSQQEIFFIRLCSAAARSHSDLNKISVIGWLRQREPRNSLHHKRIFYRVSSVC